MLEGKELEKKFDGDNGELFIDASMDGKVKIGVSYSKQVVSGVSVKSANEVEIGLAELIHMAADKSGNAVLKLVAEAVDKAVAAGAALGAITGSKAA